MKIPNKVKVAAYLVYQFDSVDFNFDAVLEEEDKLQEEFEQMEMEEIAQAGEAGKKAARKIKTKKAQDKVK